jgi:hypothetical protein
MRMEAKATINLDELDLINKTVGWIAPDRAEIQLSDNEIKLTCWGGTWPDDLDHRVRSLQKWHHVEVDLFDGVVSPAFKRVIIRRLQNEDIRDQRPASEQW